MLLSELPRARVLLSATLIALISFTASLDSLAASFPVAPQARISIAVLDFGESIFGREVADTFAATLKKEAGVVVMDRDQARAAARGGEYSGSLNLSLTEARSLGAVLGCDFFVVGEAKTLRRSPSSGPIYFDSFAALLIVSARTGRLVRWDRPNFAAPTSAKAEQALFGYFSTSLARPPYIDSIHRAQEAEQGERAVIVVDQQVPLIEAAPDDDKVAAAEGLQLPRPFRRFVPPYPQTASEGDIEAIVDVLVDLDAAGEVTRVEVERWAGFGLDEATIETVRRLHFFPALRNRVAVSIRVLLRYNFRKPPR
jgi:TonB family protein